MPLIMSQFTAYRHWLRLTVYHNYYAFNLCINSQPTIIGSDQIINNTFYALKHVLIHSPQSMAQAIIVT